jgi:hypothetical protein
MGEMSLAEMDEYWERAKSVWVITKRIELYVFLNRDRGIFRLYIA